MIKLKFLTEKKKKKKDDKKDLDMRKYPEIIMLPDTILEKDRLIKFLKETYNIKIKDES